MSVKQSEDELNCGGCGYDSCRDFAVALVEAGQKKHVRILYATGGPRQSDRLVTKNTGRRITGR
ncbi:MAG: (Fe-S)-binding protein [Odoribacter splanchnicus]